MGGTDWGFYDTSTPNWLAAGASAHVQRDYYVATDGEEFVRAGYCLKPEVFFLRGTPIELASIQGPVSEGLVNPAFGTLAFHLIRDMEGRRPNLFAWGASDRVLQLLLRLKWKQFRMPLLMRIVRSGPFLRRNGFLRHSARNRHLLDMLTLSGVGAVAIWGAQTALRLSGGKSETRAAKAEVADRFGAWADEIWEGAKLSYGLIALRDAETMNARLPQAGWPEATILKVESQGRPVGWAAVRDTTFENDGRFGDLRVGSIVDALALPGWETAVIRLATRELESRKVDLIVSNFTHPTWLAAFRRSGFLADPRRRPLLLSPTTVDTIGDDAIVTDSLHLTPMDGDGPLNL